MKTGLEQNMDQTLSHQLSMKLMLVGQTLIEIKHDYYHCFSRPMQERIKEAIENLSELSQECMTELTKTAMQNWERKRENYGERKKDPWETWTPEQMAAWREHRKDFKNF